MKIEILARWLSWLERRPVTAEVVGSSPIRVAVMAAASAVCRFCESTFCVCSRISVSISDMSYVCETSVGICESVSSRHTLLYIRDLSSAGRASALQAEGHRFEPYRSHCITDNVSVIIIKQIYRI